MMIMIFTCTYGAIPGGSLSVHGFEEPPHFVLLSVYEPRLCRRYGESGVGSRLLRDAICIMN